jgi:hypothetical protein
VGKGRDKQRRRQKKIARKAKLRGVTKPPAAEVKPKPQQPRKDKALA